MAELHRLLARQLRRLQLDQSCPPSPEAWAGVLDVIGQHYAHVDADRQLMARAMRISSDEMSALSRALEQQRAALEGVVGLVGEVLGSLNAVVDCRADGVGDVRGAVVVREAKRSLEYQLNQLLGTPANRTESTPRIITDLLHLTDQVHEMLLQSAAQAGLQHEVEVASAVQSLLLPQDDTFCGETVTLAGFMRPAGLCSGDWWSVARLDPSHVLAVIGDITGHGIASALITGVAKAACDMACMRADLGSPGEVLAIMNQCIHRAARGNLFMTCATAIFDAEASTVSLSSAGHPAPILIRTRAGTRTVESLLTPGDPLGWSQESRYATRVVNVEPGDVLVWYTDGLVECANLQGRPLGIRRFLKWMGDAPIEHSPALRDFVVDNVSRYCAGHALEDDMTLLVARIAGRPDHAAAEQALVRR